MPSKLDEDERNNLSDRASSSPSEVADADSGEEDESSGSENGDYGGRVQGSDEEEEHEDSNLYTMDVNGEELDEEEFESVTVDVAHGRTFEEMFDRRKIVDFVAEDSEEEVDSVADKKDEPDSDCEILSLELNTTAKAVSKDSDGERELEESEEERDLADPESGESEVPTYDDNDLQKSIPVFLRTAADDDNDVHVKIKDKAAKEQEENSNEEGLLGLEEIMNISHLSRNNNEEDEKGVERDDSSGTGMKKEESDSESTNSARRSRKKVDAEIGLDLKEAFVSLSPLKSSTLRSATEGRNTENSKNLRKSEVKISSLPSPSKVIPSPKTSKENQNRNSPILNVVEQVGTKMASPPSPGIKTETDSEKSFGPRRARSTVMKHSKSSKLNASDPEETLSSTAGRRRLTSSSSDSAVRRSSRLAEKDPSGPLDRVMDIIEGSTVLGKQPSGKQTGKTGTCDS
jgi:hypothetical protein